jgi:hypothetical protein
MGAADDKEPDVTKFMILTKYGADEGVEPMTNWAAEDVTAHLDFLRALNRELIDRGELVDGQALAGPELAKIVTAGTMGAPVITDGPFPEFKELLAGYQMVDVESEARAIEIAAKLSAAPGSGGVPIRQPIEVRQVMGALPGVDL